jgi:hypothetical protein
MFFALAPTRPGHRWAALLISLLVSLGLSQPTAAYSVLAHEAIIDVVWASSLRPLLLQRFPNATHDELRVAHGYAYGGAIIQDIGYYPHGNRFVSDLTHYVRSGDFIVALLHDAKDLNEYAFALGALSHYAADNDGHRIATNRAVPVLYPKLARKFGPVVTYEDDPLAHVKAEFGFDVLEVAKGRYAPDAFHDFIGFHVAARLLDQAFQETYGLELKSVLDDEEEALESYRRGVSKQIPKATRIAWSLKKNDIKADQPGITKKTFLYNLSRANYEKRWGKAYKKPTLGERFLAFLWKLLPKVGPLQVLELRTPTPQTEAMFQDSFNAVLERYRGLLQQQGTGSLMLPNSNFDVGNTTSPGAYFMNDDVHATLLNALAERHFTGVSPGLRDEILDFYKATDAPYSTKRRPEVWQRVQTQLLQLRTAQLSLPAAVSIQ